MSHWIDVGCDRMLDLREVGVIHVIGGDSADTAISVREFELIELAPGVPGWTAVATIRGVRMAGTVASLTHIEFATIDFESKLAVEEYDV